VIVGDPPFVGTPTDPMEAATPQRVAVTEVIRAVPGYDEFEIDIEKVMRADLPMHFASVEAAPLTAENVLLIPGRAKEPTCSSWTAQRCTQGRLIPVTASATV
jgi:hypothetical protein